MSRESIEPESAHASNPGPEEIVDLGDLQDLAAAPTAHMISVQVNSDGTASFAVPRAEVGQGMTTAVAMMVAEEMDLPLDKVDVSLADARPELVFNQLTGGSNSMRSIYLPVRTAAAIARQQLVSTAAARWKVPAFELSTRDGVITHRSGKRASYGSLAKAAAVSRLTTVSVELKPQSEFTVLGTPRNRVDAYDIVTGRKKFAMDLDVPNAKPTMVRRPPTINGTVRPVLPNVSPAANWAVVPGQRCARDNSRDWSCREPALKSNVLTCGYVLPCGCGHVQEHWAVYPGLFRSA